MRRPIRSQRRLQSRLQTSRRFRSKVNGILQRQVLSSGEPLAEDWDPSEDWLQARRRA